MGYRVRMLLSVDDNYRPDHISPSGSHWADCGNYAYKEKSGADALVEELTNRNPGKTYLVFEEA